MGALFTMVFVLLLAAGLSPLHAKRFCQALGMRVDVAPKGLLVAIMSRIQATDGATRGRPHKDVTGPEHLTPEFVGEWIDGQRAEKIRIALELGYAVKALNDLDAPPLSNIAERIRWLGQRDRDTMPFPEPWHAEIDAKNPSVVRLSGNGGFSLLSLASPEIAAHVVEQLLAQFQHRGTVASSDGHGRDFAAEIDARRADAAPGGVCSLRSAEPPAQDIPTETAA